MPNSNNLYGFPQPLSQVFPAPIIAQRAPTTADIAYPIGQQWIDEVGDDAYILVDVTAGVATWNVTATTPGNVDTLTGNSGGAITPSAGNINVIGSGVLAFAGAGSTLTGSITPGSSLIATLTGGSGGALSPTSGNMNLLGTANQITSTGSGSTITFSIPSAFTAPGSITSTTTMTSGTGITSTTGNIVASTGNITSTLGSVAAATTVTAGTGITATTGNIVASTGNITSTLGSVGAATTVTAGTSITATLGNITATNGDVVLGTAGNKIRSTSVASTTTAGANSFGKVSLSGGAAVVSTSAAHTASIIFLTTQALGTVATPMPIAVTARSDGVSFTITSSDGTDTSSIGWMIIN